MSLNAAGDAVVEENIDLATGFNAPIDLIVAGNGDILVAEHNEAGQPGA